MPLVRSPDCTVTFLIIHSPLPDNVSQSFSANCVLLFCASTGFTKIASNLAGMRSLFVHFFFWRALQQFGGLPREFYFSDLLDYLDGDLLKVCFGLQHYGSPLESTKP